MFPIILCLLTFWTPLGLLLANTIAHECGHASFFKSRRLNYITGTIMGALAFLPFQARRKEHAHHHAFSGSFQEKTVVRAQRKLGKLARLYPNLFAVCWRAYIPIFAVNEYVSLWRRGKPHEFLLLLSIWLPLIYFFPWLLITVYLYFVGVELVNLPHHLTEPIWDTKGKPVPKKDQLLATKSCSSIPIISKYFLLNFNYHREHHMNPEVNWKDLPKHYDGTYRKTEFAWSAHYRKLPWMRVFNKYLINHG